MIRLLEEQGLHWLALLQDYPWAQEQKVLLMSSPGRLRCQSKKGLRLEVLPALSSLVFCLWGGGLGSARSCHVCCPHKLVGPLPCCVLVPVC